MTIAMDSACLLWYLSDSELFYLQLSAIFKEYHCEITVVILWYYRDMFMRICGVFILFLYKIMFISVKLK